jgi:hypothetical protein
MSDTIETPPLTLAEKRALNPEAFDFGDIKLPSEKGTTYNMEVMLGGLPKSGNEAKAKAILTPLNATLRPLKLRQQREVAKMQEALTENPTYDDFMELSIKTGTLFLYDADGKPVTEDWVMDNLNAEELNYLIQVASGTVPTEGE